MGDSEALDSANQAVSDALSSSLRNNGRLLVRWVALAEVIDDDGGRAFMSMTADGLSTWDFLGLIEYARMSTQSQDFRDHSTDD